MYIFVKSMLDLYFTGLTIQFNVRLTKHGRKYAKAFISLE